MTEEFIYKFVPIDGEAIIPVEAGTYLCVILIERPVSESFRERTSNTLVRTGCRFMMAWGVDCSLWDDSVDYANIMQFFPAEIPESQFVMTTWHDKDTLEDVFFYAKHNMHSSFNDVKYDSLVVLDLGQDDRSDEIKEAFNAASKGLSAS